jgi:hypothetical protein
MMSTSPMPKQNNNSQPQSPEGATLSCLNMMQVKSAFIYQYQSRDR